MLAFLFAEDGAFLFADAGDANRSAELAASPPDPIFGIWFLNWRHMVGHDTLFSDGLMALLEPEAFLFSGKF